MSAESVKVRFAPLPAGEIVRCHRDTAGVLRVTVDGDQLILAATGEAAAFHMARANAAAAAAEAAHEAAEQLRATITASNGDSQ